MRLLNTKEFNLIINKEEHLLFMFNTSRNFLKELIRFIQIVSKLGLQYEFNERFGYLMQNTRYCGHGVKLKVHLKLPNDK